MIWSITDLIKNLFFSIIKIIEYVIENFGVLVFAFSILFSVAIFKINYQPYSFLIIMFFFAFTIADLKSMAKDVAIMDTILKQILVLFYRMGGILFSMVFFYAMAKSDFMSGEKRPVHYVLENFKTFIEPKLSINNPNIDFIMILSYLLWVGCCSTCICMQPKEREKEKSTLREIFENNIKEAEKLSKVNVQKSQFSAQRANRKGYLSK
jgi:hypothetical protein|tara:strand:+ start:109 stop:735 length:627 start_codon:yes stop_codon:yes gene_type:complete